MHAWGAPFGCCRAGAGVPDPAVIAAAAAVAEATAVRGAGAVMMAHTQLWSEFWAESAIDITTNATGPNAMGPNADGLGSDLALLEANYYGSQ